MRAGRTGHDDMRRRHHGFTLIELLFTVATLATLVGIALPMLLTGIDDYRTGMAAGYFAGRVRSARMDAVRRSRAVAFKFEAGAPDYTYTPYADGNRNGVRTADIERGADSAIGPAERIGDHFSEVRFGLLPGIPDADGGPRGNGDGVRIGSARILTLSPDGTATAGTLYIQGRRAQYAVRVLGVTGRTRVLKFDAGERTWISR